MIMTPLASSSIEHAVGVAAANMGASMIVGEYYTLVANVAFWFKQGTDAALTGSPASAGAGSMYWPANLPLTLRGDEGPDVSIIEDAATGKASLTRMINF
jgi:hypothetical protein